ncbi:hypothetical protein BJP34_18985 [Moorena producens PAL-8-15-08-1]|uniref:Uncharacterized protein n=1 Tax=Moorena producens PAL-8-15-08-1 TaxID=1458985 RepID=A0A1D8TUF1_9CYAN|nr:hypothetical protein BJP34_18985 [Moorena producens PAL-8-15-08-1]
MAMILPPLISNIAILRLVRYNFLVFREQGAGSREQGAGSREQGAGSREQGAGKREKIMCTS